MRAFSLSLTHTFCCTATRSGVNLSSVGLISAKDVKDTPILSMNPLICSKPSPDLCYLEFDANLITALASEVSMLYREVQKDEFSNEWLHSMKQNASSSRGPANDNVSTSGSESIAESATSCFTESASDGGDNDAKATECNEATVVKNTDAQLSDIASIGQVMALSSSPRYDFSQHQIHLTHKHFFLDCSCQAPLPTRFFRSMLPFIVSRKHFPSLERMLEI